MVGLLGWNTMKPALLGVLGEVGGVQSVDVKLSGAKLKSVVDDWRDWTRFMRDVRS